MNSRADWLAWALQFVVGLVVGAMIGLYWLYGNRGVAVTPATAALPFIVGASLIGGALASRFGDRLWLGESFRVIPPDEPRQSDASRWASFGAGLAGVALVAIALLRAFGFAP